MNAWNIDANSIELNDIKSQDLDVMMVLTPAIREFLSYESKKRFIVAPKGFGKTYLLKVKSQLFRDNSKGYKFLPGNNLCERFVDLNITLSTEDIVKFNDLEVWKKLWKLCLYTLIIINYKQDNLPSSIREIIKTSNTLCDIFSCFLINRKRIDKFFENELILLSRAVQDLSEASNVNQIAIFVDNIDEALEKYVGVNKKDISKDIWINAQLALLLVSNDLCSRNAHIKFYMTIRSEAYNQYEGTLKMQLDSLCVFLNYTKSQIKDIFYKNIRLMDAANLIKPRAHDPIEAFIGYNKMQHKFIVDDNDIPQSEDVFDFIYRHTYKRPREIVKMGGEITSLEHERTDYKQLAKKINEVSSSLFLQYKSEILPYFREDIFEALCSKVNNNIIRFEDAQRINEEIKTEIDKDINAFSYFYKLGLVGIVEHEVKGQLTQSFLNVGEYSLTNLRTRMVNYYVVHPSLNDYFKHYIGFYDKFNIVGYDLPINMERKKRQETHVHFGIDRESLTLLLPELCDAKSLAVIMQPSYDLVEIAEATTFIISLNSSIYSFQIISDYTSDENVDKLFKGWLNKDFSIVVCSSNKELIKKCLLAAQVMSCCSLTEGIRNILIESLPFIPLEDQPYFYLCFKEFIDNKYNILRDFLLKLNPALRVSPVLVDRYQYGYDVIFSRDELTIRFDVIAEEYGCIICFDKKNAILKSSNVIRRIKSQAEFDFYKYRQNYLVESLYQLYRLLHHDGILDSSTDLINEFINIQIKRVISSISSAEFQEVFPTHTKNDLEARLRVFSKNNQQRMLNLITQKSLNISDRSIHVNTNKEKLIFPRDYEFLRLLQSGKAFYERDAQNVFLELYKLLETQALPEKKTWFISYSSIDIEYAKIIHSRLILMGCKAVIYCNEIVKGAIKGFEILNVKNNDKMIFLASENSLKSDACHRELRECFSVMRKNNDTSKLIIISLDDYVFRIDPDVDVLDDGRKENFKFIVNHINVINMAQYFNLNNFKQLHENLSSINDN